MSSINGGEGLKDWFESNSIRACVLDLDDTICRTDEIFRRHLGRTTVYLAREVGINPHNLWKEVREINKAAYHSHKVNPNRWVPVLDKLQNRYTVIDQGIKMKGLEILGEIYTTSPRFFWRSRRNFRSVK